MKKRFPDEVFYKKLLCVFPGFDLGRPLPLHFLRRNSKAGNVDALTHTLAKYAMELTLVDYKMAHIKPSVIAAAALALSLKVSHAPSTKLPH